MASPVKPRPTRTRAGTVDAYLEGLEGWQLRTARSLRRIVRKAAPSAGESIKWGQPVYEANGPFCYIRAFSKAVNLGFWRGASLRDLEPAIQSGGMLMGHLRFCEGDALRPERIAQLVAAALELNARDGDPTRRRAR